MSLKTEQIKTVGIIGGGQLGRFLVLSAKNLDLNTIVLCPVANSPASQVADKQIVGHFLDPKAIKQLASESDLITYEIDSGHLNTLIDLSKKGHIIHPSPDVLAITKDKYRQKVVMIENDIPVVPGYPVFDIDDIYRVTEDNDYPIYLKYRFNSDSEHDWFIIHSEDEVEEAYQYMEDRPVYVEIHVPFVKELSVVAARSMDGEIVGYPVSETKRVDKIIETTIAPAEISDHLASEAQQIAGRVLRAMDAVGVFGVEMYLTAEGGIFVKKVVPRVHDGGHYTLDACNASQFDQHIRAITGRALEDCSMNFECAMTKNILGNREGSADPEGLTGAHDLPGVSVYIYGKEETRPLRKMGHINVVGDDYTEIADVADRASSFIRI